MRKARKGSLSPFLSLDIGVDRIVIIKPEGKIISVINEDRSLKFYTFQDEVEFFNNVKIK